MENNLRTTAIGGAGFALLCALTDLHTAMFAALVLACAAAVFGAGVALGFAGVSAVGCVADSTRGSRTLRGLRLALYTPPFAFCLLCLALPVALEPIAPLGEPLGLPFLLAWPVLLWCAVALAVVAWTFAGSGAQSVATLGRADAWIASWYLCNGFFFNSMMDVFAGLLQAWPTMTGRYNELEPRYALAGTCAGVTVVLTSWQELLVQAPCGLALFYAYWRGAPWQLPLEIVFNSWSVAGVLYFYGSEPALGFPHVHAPFSGGAKTPDPVSGVAAPLVFDAAEATSFASLYKFWLGFVIFPGLWAIAGVALTARAIVLIAKHVAVSTRLSKGVGGVDGVGDGGGGGGGDGDSAGMAARGGTTKPASRGRSVSVSRSRSSRSTTKAE